MFLQSLSFAQEIYTARKGSRFFPGHLDIVISVDSNKIRYEVFNHWYSWSYAELRQITIPIDSLETFNSGNDTIMIESRNKNVKLHGKRYGLRRQIKHRNLCASPETMRKISFAYEISIKYEDIKHFELYEREDLKLPEKDFQQIVRRKLNEKIR